MRFDFLFSLLSVSFSFSKYPFYNPGLGFLLHLHSHQLVQGTNHKWKAKHWYLAGAYFSICVDVSIHYVFSHAMRFLVSLFLLLEEYFIIGDLVFPPFHSKGTFCYFGTSWDITLPIGFLFQLPVKICWGKANVAAL